MPEACKETALRASLNCGRCKGEHTVYVMSNGILHTEKRAHGCADSPRCGHWHLHRFRHSFAKSVHQSGVDIRSLQLLLGHKNLSTTEEYLKSLRLGDLREKIQSSQLMPYL